MVETGSKKAAIVACSNGIDPDNMKEIALLKKTLNELGIEVVFSDYLYKREFVFSGNAKDRASALMNFYNDDNIMDIFDISGGDIANEIIPYLDYSVIEKSKQIFWGYSDLTTIINAIYAKTGRASVLYQIRNLTGTDREAQINRFIKAYHNEGMDLFNFPCKFIQGDRLEGIVVGGNIRCFLKLAGTPYMPDLNDKILFLEAYHGSIPQLVTYLSQLRLMGAFSQIKGIILGSFTELENDGYGAELIQLVKSYVTGYTPIAKTNYVGHGDDSRALLIGSKIFLEPKH